MKILVRAPNWIGDQILAYPFFHFLRKAYPGARIAAVCMPWVESIQFRDLVDEVHVLPRPVGSGWRARFDAVETAARELRALGPWDLGICLPNSLSSAWLLYRSGVRQRRGYATDGRGILLKPALDWEGRRSIHRAEDYLGLLPESARPARSVHEFWGTAPENELDPRVPGELERFDPRASWYPGGASRALRGEGDGPIDPPATPYWVLAPGSTAESRRWPVAGFAELARQILASTGLRGVIVGGPSETRVAMELTSDRSLGLIDMTAQGTVAANWRLFAGARFTVSNDSGLAHVAALCGSPTQVIWGAGDPKRTTPLGPGKVRVMFNPVECWPCERNVCALPPARKIECLRGIAPEAVWKEIQSGIRPA